MSEEEAVEVCKKIKESMKYESDFDLNILKLNRNNETAIETLLQSRKKDKTELEKKDKIINEIQAEIKELQELFETEKRQYEDLVEEKEKLEQDYILAIKENEKKDKIINEMAKIMSRNMSCNFIRTTDKECANTDCEKCFKQFFERKVENGN